MSFNRLITKIEETDNPTVVGLDPNLSFVPSFLMEKYFREEGKNLKSASKAVIEWNKGIIDSIYDIVPAVKLQLSYYETLGHNGIYAFEETIKYAKENGLYVIADGKRNDIGTTMNAYGEGYIGNVSYFNENMKVYDVDAMTVNPYMGYDTVKPLLDICEISDKAIFVLVKTSNPSSSQLQDLILENGEPLYITVAKLVEEWGENVGAVVGATYPKQLEQLRTLMPETFFLVPGFGAQGAKAEDVKTAFSNKGAIINASRSIICAYKNMNVDERDYKKATRKAIIDMREELKSVRS
ncbi:MAG: orotidine-5'-phosphate decarboxylase [Clostridia bacterium]|nr:orotidine-5'-phosphate decarboxylase [Clostridia bacterium]